METPPLETPLLGPGLYIVATPIGNLGDVSRRAIDILSACALIACEDTRVTGKLLHHIGIKRPMRRYDDHASDAAREQLLGEMCQIPVALVSDAGTPLISDPGYRLVRAARARGIPVTSIPGASALITALTLAGLPTDRFVFAGFLPSKEKARGDTLSEMAVLPMTLVFYETGPRLVASLEAMARIMPGREIAVARELTKLHEECRSGSAADLAGPPSAPEKPGLADIDAQLMEALAELPPSQAAGRVAKAHGLDRKALYARALAFRGELKG
jgi:16S rRNA (cytidine1402-2'-O)-methyltransferase